MRQLRSHRSATRPLELRCAGCHEDELAKPAGAQSSPSSAGSETEREYDPHEELTLVCVDGIQRAVRQSLLTEFLRSHPGAATGRCSPTPSPDTSSSARAVSASDPTLGCKKLLFLETFAVTSPVTGDERIIDDSSGRNVCRFPDHRGNGCNAGVHRRNTACIQSSDLRSAWAGRFDRIFFFEAARRLQGFVCGRRRFSLVMFSRGPGSRLCLIWRVWTSFRSWAD